MRGVPIPLTILLAEGLTHVCDASYFNEVYIEVIYCDVGKNAYMNTLAWVNNCELNKCPHSTSAAKSKPIVSLW